MFRNLIPLLIAPLVLAAQQPQTPVQPAIADGTFRPISLSDALRLARENNFQAITASNQTRSSTNTVRAARAAVLPNVNVSANQNKSAGQRLGQSGTLVPYTSSWTYSTNLSGNLTLFDGGKMFSDIRARKADVAASQANEVTTDANLGLQVKQQYNAVLSANEQEAAARAQLALAQQQLAVSIARVNAGAANVADSLNNVVSVGNAQLAILNAQQNLRAASAQLTRLVSTPYLVTANPADTSDLTMHPVDSLTIAALSLEGPVIRQLQAQAASFESARRSARAAYLPSLTMNFSYGGNGTGYYGVGGGSFPYSRSVGFGLNYPIFNRFQRENQVQAADINLDNAQAQLRDQRLAAQQTVITQIGLLRNAEQKIQVQQISVRASDEALRVNQQRYALGAGTMVDVLTSQSNLIVARQQLIQARLDYRNARAQIEAVIGRDLP
jgi:outer membrane protein